jgi:hypothetical protein
MAVKLHEKNGKPRAFLGGAVLGAALLAASSAVAAEPYEVDVGLWTCPRGYQIQHDGTCKSDDEIPHGPIVEISSLPSAGDGAPTTCPSGGCDSLAAPFYWSIYSAATQLGYGAWSSSYYGGCGARGRRFHSGELAFGGLAPLSLAPGGFVSVPQRHFGSFSARSSQTRSLGGRFFGGTVRGTSSHRAGQGRTWR